MKLRAEELIGRMSQLVEPAEDWHEVGTQDEPTLGSGVTNTSGFETAAYRKQAKLVSIKGRVDHVNLGGVTIFTLPEGYRPNSDLIKPTGIVVGGVWYGGIIYIQTTGVINILGNGTITSGSIDTSFYLDN